jgi:hypothetical protein
MNESVVVLRTVLLNSNPKATGAAQNGSHCLWNEEQFPLYDSAEQGVRGYPGTGGQKTNSAAKKDRESVEKEPTRHLRYFSDYLAGEGDFVRKYGGD